jgi:hypothetical protein
MIWRVLDFTAPGPNPRSQITPGAPSPPKALGAAPADIEADTTAKHVPPKAVASTNDRPGPV